MSGRAGLYFKGAYLGKPKHLPLVMGADYRVVGRIVKGPTWWRPWRIDRWMSDRELNKHRSKFALAHQTAEERDGH
jgi:hypothetical protein